MFYEPQRGTRPALYRGRMELSPTHSLHNHIHHFALRGHKKVTFFPNTLFRPGRISTDGGRNSRRRRRVCSKFSTLTKWNGDVRWHDNRLSPTNDGTLSLANPTPGDRGWHVIAACLPSCRLLPRSTVADRRQ